MKRKELIRQLAELGAVYESEGARHTLYRSRSGLKIAVPRHAEIHEGLAKHILKEAKG